MSRLQRFSYDGENRLVKAETLVNGKMESSGAYRYDSLGRRVAKVSVVNGVTEQKHYLWQGLRMLREETPGQSSLYLYEPGSYAPLARVDQTEGGEQNLPHEALSSGYLRSEVVWTAHRTSKIQ